MSDPTVLCVDGDDESRAETAAVLAEWATVVEAGTASEATATLESDPIDCVVMEYDLPDGTGIDLLGTVRELLPDTPCLLFTDADPGDIDTSALEGGIVEYVQKGDANSRDRLSELTRELTANRTQVAYPVPDDEDARLAALERYQRDDMDVQDTFDRLTKLAGLHTGVNVTFIGLVAEHEEDFVSCYGRELTPLDREDTMCTHAILSQDAMVVEDVEADERFANNQALDDLNIKAYAGAPMRTPDGMAIGSFCLVHDEPRSFSDEEVEFLRLLADEAMEQLELRRQLNGRAEGDAE
jgi:CheY-like chemotaxis protein